jgi:hypothetical protein
MPKNRGKATDRARWRCTLLLPVRRKCCTALTHPQKLRFANKAAENRAPSGHRYYEPFARELPP